MASSSHSFNPSGADSGVRTATEFFVTDNGVKVFPGEEYQQGTDGTTWGTGSRPCDLDFNSRLTYAPFTAGVGFEALGRMVDVGIVNVEPPLVGDITETVVLFESTCGGCPLPMLLTVTRLVTNNEGALNLNTTASALQGADNADYDIRLAPIAVGGVTPDVDISIHPTSFGPGGENLIIRTPISDYIGGPGAPATAAFDAGAGIFANSPVVFSNNNNNNPSGIRFNNLVDLDLRLNLGNNLGAGFGIRVLEGPNIVGAQTPIAGVTQTREIAHASIDVQNINDNDVVDVTDELVEGGWAVTAEGYRYDGEPTHVMVHAQCNFSSGTQRSAPVLNLEKLVGGAFIQVATSATGYIRSLSGHNQASHTIAWRDINPGANPQYRLSSGQEANGGPANVIAGTFDLEAITNV